MNPFLIAEAETAHAAAGAPVEHTSGGITIGEHWIASLPGVNVPGFGSQFHADTVFWTAVVMVLLLIVFASLAKTVNPVPSEESGATGSVLEFIVDFAQGMIHDFISPNAKPFLWFIGSLFVFILSSNWLSLLPWKAFEMWAGEPFGALVGSPHPLPYEAPTADLNTTLAMALVTLVMYWFYGLKNNGLGGFLGHHWFAAPALLFPLRMLEDVTRPMSLALRLFANMTAGHVVGLVLLMLTYFVVPSILLPLELFVGAVQAFVFAVLSASYIGAAAADHSHH